MLDVGDLEKKIHQNDEKVTGRVDQIKHNIEEELKNSQEFTKATLEENIESIDEKLRAEMTEMDLNMKSLEVKIEQSFEKSIESSNNVAQTVQDLNKSQSENLQSLKSEISTKFSETDHHNRSMIANIEERLATETEKKITQLGKEFFHEKCRHNNNDIIYIICQHLLDIFFERHIKGKSVEKSVEEIKDCLEEVMETFEKDKEENLRQIRSLGNYSDQI